jgi:protein-L-isoaspartate(D-aspartate) O-methyltransferase
MITDKAASERLREDMVDRQIRARGVRSRQVLRAMRTVRREGYVPSYLGEFAYEDTPLPIEEEQTISQPYIVGYMIDALRLKASDRVLEIGTGSGYAAAVLAEIAGEVYTIERHQRLAESAVARLERDGYTNVHVRHGDGTLGWPEQAPFDAIVVAAGGPHVPDSLRRQLAIGGRMVIPVGGETSGQELIRVTRTDEERFAEEKLGPVRFVPLVGEEGWRVPARERVEPPHPSRAAALIARCAEPFEEIGRADLAPLLERIGAARVVLLGESTHGTSEFYRMRARITKELIEHRGFTIVAAEADWPDAALVDHYVRDRRVPRAEWQAFARFPTWMWRNRETAEFVEWLRGRNIERSPGTRVRFAGLDLYALHNSIDSVLRYLDDVDPEAAAVARHRYGCLTPWQKDPAAYGRAVLTGGYRSCESEVVATLQELMLQRLVVARREDERLFEAIQNARLVADGESYYRAMYYGAHESWNLRDRHMFDCLRQLLEHHGPRAKMVVWAHNSHVGDATATEMAARGEWNLGQLCRQELAAGEVYSVGFGTDHGTVAAASYWGGPRELKTVRPSLESSYERLCHDSRVPRFLLSLRSSHALADLLAEPRLQRAIGVIYRPETERASHYFHAVLPEQFDELIWFDRSEAVHPLEARELADVPDTYPFGL